MIKVILADDEPKVCNLIRNLFDWASLGMVISGVAENGIEALELIEIHQPDLIITDIRMPGCDGLELIRRAKELKGDLEFIIISGHRHFEYAQAAIRYGVSDYIPKPIDRDEMLETLQKMRRKNLQKQSRLSEEAKRQMRSEVDKLKLRQGFLQNLLQDTAVNSPPGGLEHINREYHYRFSAGLFQAFLVKMDYAMDGTLQSEIKMFGERIEKVCAAGLEPICSDMQMYIQGNAVYGILNYGEDKKNAVRKQLQTALDELLVKKSIVKNMELTLSLGKAFLDIGDLYTSLKEAERCTYQRLIQGPGHLIEEAPASDAPTERAALLSSFSDAIDAALEFLSEDGARDAVAALRQGLLSIPNQCGASVFHAVAEAYQLYLIALQNHGMPPEDAPGELLEFTRHAEFFSSAGQLFDYLAARVFGSLSAIADDIRQAELKPIRIAKQYIQDHYMEPITLEEVSSVAGFNATYFSSFFKKKSGVNFQDYLTEIRMERAKQLLRETTLGVTDICREVGYADQKHFTKGFKKYAGVSPNEYRKIYG